MWRRYFLAGIAAAALTLAACDSEQTVEPPEQTQQYFFLESLRQVEAAGLNLQSQSSKSSDVKQAINALDSGIKLAFQVESKFLDQFDPRLSKNYQRYFVKGIESYRLGIEAGDSNEQKQGLRLISQWAAFWSNAKNEITSKMSK